MTTKLKNKFPLKNNKLKYNFNVILCLLNIVLSNGLNDSHFNVMINTIIIFYNLLF